MVKEVYISYPCISTQYGGYNMYPPLLLVSALDNTLVLHFKSADNIARPMHGLWGTIFFIIQWLLSKSVNFSSIVIFKFTSWIMVITLS